MLRVLSQFAVLLLLTGCCCWFPDACPKRGAHIKRPDHHIDRDRRFIGDPDGGTVNTSPQVPEMATASHPSRPVVWKVMRGSQLIALAWEPAQDSPPWRVVYSPTDIPFLPTDHLEEPVDADLLPNRPYQFPELCARLSTMTGLPSNTLIHGTMPQPQPPGGPIDLNALGNLAPCE